MKCKFYDCDEHPIQLSEFCWDHLKDKGSYKAELFGLLGGGRALSRFNLKKVDLENARLEKAILHGANLSQANLSRAHLFDAQLEGAELVGVNMNDCDLTHCVLKDADLTKASLAGARLWNANLEGANLTESDLSNADLSNASLFNVKLCHATLAGAKSITKENFSSSDKFFANFRVNETGIVSAEKTYRDLKKYFISNGMYNDASWASFKEKTMERHRLRKKRDFNYLPSFLMNVLCGYGEKPYRIVISSISTILVFAFIYFALDAVRAVEFPDQILKWSDYLYYSTITFTTVGYGDFVPRPNAIFKFLAASEAFMGVFLSGLFIFTLARKYSAR